jgi:hypothetical protein
MALPEGDCREPGGVAVSFMWTIVLLSLVAVAVAAIGVAGLAWVVRALRSFSPWGPSSPQVDTRWRFSRNAAHVERVEAMPGDSEIRDEG